MGVPLVSDTMTIQFFIFIGFFSWCSLYNVQCPRDAAKERKLFSSMASTNKDMTPCHCHKIKLIILMSSSNGVSTNYTLWFELLFDQRKTLKGMFGNKKSHNFEM